MTLLRVLEIQVMAATSYERDTLLVRTRRSHARSAATYAFDCDTLDHRRNNVPVPDERRAKPVRQEGDDDADERCIAGQLGQTASGTGLKNGSHVEARDW